MRTLDHSRDFGTIHGATGIDAAYEQDGCWFDGQGRQCDERGYTIRGAPLPPVVAETVVYMPPVEMVASTPMTFEEAIVGSTLDPKPEAILTLCTPEDQGAIRVPDLNWPQLRKLAFTYCPEAKVGLTKELAREMLDEAGITHVRYA